MDLQDTVQPILVNDSIKYPVYGGRLVALSKKWNTSIVVYNIYPFHLHSAYTCIFPLIKQRPDVGSDIPISSHGNTGLTEPCTCVARTQSRTHTNTCSQYSVYIQI